MKLTELFNNTTENTMETRWTQIKEHLGATTDKPILSENKSDLSEQITLDKQVVAVYNRQDNFIIFETEDIRNLPKEILVSLDEARRVWAKSGDKLVRKFRCTSGRRKGRVVASPEQCNKPIDIKKRLTMKKTVRRKGKVMQRKAKRAKRINPVSKQVSRLNKSTGG